MGAPARRVTLSSTFVFLVVGHRAANHPKPLMQVSAILHTFRIDASKIGCAEYLDWVFATRHAVGNRWRRHGVGADRHADVYTV
jgi:hypothetical protein